VTRQSSVDVRLKEFCATDRQREYIDAINEHGGVMAAAKALGISFQVISESISKAKAKAAEAAREGHAPGHFNSGTAPGYLMGKVTVQRAKDGGVERTWERQSPDAQQAEAALREFAATLADSVKGLAPRSAEPLTATTNDLLSVIPIGDPHFGLRVWHAEGGGNFDLDIAEQLTQGAIDRLTDSAPRSHTAILLNLGDHFHLDSQANTTTSGTPVDADGRWAKIQQIGLRAMIYCVNRLLERHQLVIVRINRGNHDKHSAYALSLMLSCYFHNEPRVEVDLSPAAVWYHQFGRVLIGSTHGDTIKGDKLVGVMAADKPVQWGETRHRYWLVGHVHHTDKKEYPGGMVEYFRTLAVGDAWHHGQGYRSGRDMCLIVLHKDHGEVERHRVDAGMIE
jgi:hypothetical protein